MEPEIFENKLLDGKDTKAQIERLFSTCANQIFLSAYFTESAYEWLKELSFGSPIKLVVRGRPNDFLSGASDFNAVRKAFSSGWDIRFISILHAKVYLLGEKIVVGSGNLTANGMHLMSSGNLELNSVISASTESRALVETVFNEAQPFDDICLDKMDEFLCSRDVQIEDNDWWPQEVIPPICRALFCNDFPQLEVGVESGSGSDCWSDISKLLQNGEAEKAASSFVKTQPYIWLRSTLVDSGGDLHFGGLTKSLHDTLTDNPAPYRSTVKSLLSNLLTFLQKMPDIGMIVERPHHRQIVKII